MSRKKRAVCTYCGYLDARTKDHIPPKCLFGAPLPSTMITVPCCKKCHSATPKDDEFFRLMLTMRHDVYEHPDVQAVLPKVFRSLEREDQLAFARGFARSCYLADVTTPSGVYVGKREAYNVPLDRLNRVVTRIALGLYFRHTGHRLPDGYHAFSCLDEQLNYQSPKTKEKLQVEIAKVLATPRHTVGRVFRYHFAIIASEPGLSVWIMNFYAKISFLAVTRELEGRVIVSR